MAKFNTSIALVVALCMCFATTILSLSIPSSFGMPSRGIIKSHVKHHCHHTILHLLGFSCVVGPPNSESNGITAELLHQFNLMAQYSAASYCPGNNNGTGTPITCPVGNCPLVEAAGAHGALEFEDTLFTDDTGFVAVDDINQLIVLAFRGSRSIANWKANLSFNRRPSDLCPRCNVHVGFWDSWVEIRERVKGKVLSAIHAHPNYRFVITGHSLGGAVATLAAGEFRKMNSRLANITELFTFGSPRVGNGHTAAFLTDQSPFSYRITSMSDPIPREPGHILGFSHTSPEYWIHSHPLHPGPTDIKLVTGFYNKHGNSGKHGFKVKRHKYYFGIISHCSIDPDESQ